VTSTGSSGTAKSGKFDFSFPVLADDRG
jgi:hypothetical protein